MLDLTEEKTPLYEIKLPYEVMDGAVLHLQRPTQELQDYLIKLYSGEFESNQILLNTIMATFVTILNRNVEGVKFEEEDFYNVLGIEVCSYAIGDYFKYWNDEINKYVSFQ